MKLLLKEDASEEKLKIIKCKQNFELTRRLINCDLSRGLSSRAQLWSRCVRCVVASSSSRAYALIDCGVRRSNKAQARLQLQTHTVHGRIMSWKLRVRAWLSMKNYFNNKHLSFENAKKKKSKSDNPIYFPAEIPQLETWNFNRDSLSR